MSVDGVDVRRGVRAPARVEEILRGLPEWFGIESALLDYVEKSRTLPSYAALAGEEVVGICLVKHHTRFSSEST